MEEIISAIATPQGKGGVAIIRISGEGSLSLAQKMFRPHGKTAVQDFEPCPLSAIPEVVADLSDIWERSANK